MSERAEAARDAFYQARWEQKKPLDPIRFGIEWADANPQPTTITEKRLREFTIFVLDQADDARGVRWAVVHLLGIEVEDNDE